MLAAVLRVTPPGPLAAQPRIGLCLPAQDLGQLRILHQEGIQDRVHLALLHARRTWHGQGEDFAWTTQVIRPGGQAGMVEAGVTNLILHTITARLDGPWPRMAFRALQAEVEALHGQDALVSAWRPDESNGAFLASVPYGAIPLLVHRTRRLCVGGRPRCPAHA